MPTPTVLIVTPTYLPGFKAGGPIRSISNMVNGLHSVIEFKIITADRDPGDSGPYETITPGEWQTLGGAKVYYLTPEESASGHLQALLHDEAYDVLYLVGFFPTNSMRILWWRRWRQLPPRPVLISPRGELARAALASKPLKKAVYLKMAHSLGLLRGLVWQATSEHEAEDIQRAVGPTHVHHVPNLPVRMDATTPNQARRPKDSGCARLIYLARVLPNKGLAEALQYLATTHGEIDYHIYGTIEDENYWQQCRKIIHTLPANIRVEYRGVLPFDTVVTTLQTYHGLLLPTRWENFAHGILEAMLAGCVIITSDQTPWRNLAARQAGWDLPNDRPEDYTQALQTLVDFDQPTFETWSMQAHQVARDFIETSDVLRMNRQFLTSVANRRA